MKLFRIFIAFCSTVLLAQPPLTLNWKTQDVSSDSGTLVLSAPLPRANFREKDQGTTFLEVAPVSQRVLSRFQVDYRIEGYQMEIRVPFTPPAKPTKLRLRVQLLGLDDRYISFEAQPTIDAVQAKNTGSTPGLFARIRSDPGLYIVIAVTAVAFLFLVWIAVQGARRRRKSPPLMIAAGPPLEPVPNDHASEGPQRDLARKADELHSAPTDFLQVHNALRSDLSNIQNTLNNIQAYVGNPDEMAMLSRILDQSPPNRVPAPPIVASSLEVRLVAVANHWLQSGSRNREELKQLSAAINLNAELYTTRDLTKVFIDVTNFVYPFEPSDREGGWLWVDTPIAGQAIALPVDSVFFQMGRAPDLLERLFDGFENPPANFRFRRFYTPCVLRRAAGNQYGYTLENRGLLQLEDRQAPNVAPPVQYGALLPRTGNAGTAPSSSLQRHLATIVKRLEAVNARLDSVDQLARMASETAASAAGKPPALDAATVAMLGRLDASVKTLVEFSNNASPRLKKLEDTGTLASNGSQDFSEAISNLTRRIDQLEYGRTPAAKAPQRVAPSPQVVPPAPPAQAVAAPIPRPVAQQSYAESPAVAALPQQATPLPQWPMPANWQVALADAARMATSATGSERAVYIQRLTAVQQQLRSRTRREDSLNIDIVHLALEGEEFRIHEVHPYPTGEEMSCLECNSKQSWQLAIAVLGANGDTPSILLPLGRISTPEYYRAIKKLVENAPETAFEIHEIQRPARLCRIGGAPGAGYEVKQPLQYT